MTENELCEYGELVWSLKRNSPFYILVVIWFMAEQLYKNSQVFSSIRSNTVFGACIIFSMVPNTFCHGSWQCHRFLFNTHVLHHVCMLDEGEKRSGHQSHMINEQRPKIGSIVRPDKRICFMCASTTYLRNAFSPNCRGKCVYLKTKWTKSVDSRLSIECHPLKWIAYFAMCFCENSMCTRALSNFQLGLDANSPSGKKLGSLEHSIHNILHITNVFICVPDNKSITILMNVFLLPCATRW